MLEAFFANPALMIVLTGALVGVAASLVGTFLVLRGNSMLSDAISHSIVFGIVVVWLLTRQSAGPVQIAGAALTGILTVFLTEILVSTRRVKDDAAIGLVFPVLFSIGVLLLNVYARDVHIDEHTVLNLSFVALFYKELKLATFDAALATALGFMPGAIFYTLLALVSATAVAAFDSVGAILFIAFVIVPPSAAYLLTDRLGLMLLYGALIAIASALTGYFAATALNVSIGGMMATMTGVFLMFAFLLGPRYGLIAQVARRRGLRHSNECRTVAVHLYNHEGSPEQHDESVARALREHLMWDDAHARNVVARCIDRGFITRDGKALALTDEGRAVARAILEPWRQEGV